MIGIPQEDFQSGPSTITPACCEDQSQSSIHLPDADEEHVQSSMEVHDVEDAKEQLENDMDELIRILKQNKRQELIQVCLLGPWNSCSQIWQR